jgi:hypothetical protein
MIDIWNGIGVHANRNLRISKWLWEPIERQWIMGRHKLNFLWINISKWLWEPIETKWIMGPGRQTKLFMDLSR